jgi:hypothetical protein
MALAHPRPAEDLQKMLAQMTAVTATPLKSMDEVNRQLQILGLALLDYVQDLEFRLTRRLPPDPTGKEHPAR